MDLNWFFSRFKGLECGNCVVQWRYIAGNNWGMCEDGTGAVGCGPQEEFRACSDISIGKIPTIHLDDRVFEFSTKKILILISCSIRWTWCCTATPSNTSRNKTNETNISHYRRHKRNTGHRCGNIRGAGLRSIVTLPGSGGHHFIDIAGGVVPAICHLSLLLSWKSC